MLHCYTEGCFSKQDNDHAGLRWWLFGDLPQLITQAIIGIDSLGVYSFYFLNNLVQAFIICAGKRIPSGLLHDVVTYVVFMRQMEGLQVFMKHELV